MIEKLDIYQRGLHYKKEARLEGIPESSDGVYVLQHIVKDYNEKLNEVIDVINTILPGMQNPKPYLFTHLEEIEARLEATISDVVDKFTNNGETIIIDDYSDDIDTNAKVDTVVATNLPLLPNERSKAVFTALERAKKRVIFILPEPTDEAWGRLVARIPYHYENYENGSGFEVHLIDKEEGNAPVVSTDENI